MKFVRLIAILLFVCSVADLYANVTFDKNERVKYNFNSGWLLYVGDVPEAKEIKFDDAAWKKITLPRAFNEDDAFRVAIDEHTTGIVWYRKHFRLRASAKNKKIFVEFEGIRFGGDFYINGHLVGIHENGVMACGLDITDFVKHGGDNVIAVRIDNSWDYKERATDTRYQWNDKNFNANYGGIPKNVYLHATNRLYQTLPLFSNLKTTGTYVYAREIDVTRKRAKIYAESEVRNETGKPQKVAFEVVIEDIDRKVVKTIKGPEFTIEPEKTMIIKAGDRVENLNFWSWGYGYLYNVYTILKVDGRPLDVVKTRTGFRKTSFRDGKIKLNDRVIQLKGYAQRTSNEWPAVGMSVPAWLSDYSNRLIVEGNGNLVRWMHVTPWKQDVESCDRVGLIQAMPAGDAEKDVEGRRWEQRVGLMRDAIIYNRNNPSILFYECGNESISREHILEMKALRDKYDPYGGRAVGSREMLDIREAEWGGEMLYINKSAHHPMWATEYCRDEALRKYWDEQSFPYHKNGAGPLHKGKDASEYNRNQDSYAIEIITRWFDYFTERPGMGKRVSSGGAKIIFSDSNTHFRGEENYRRSGVVDAMRIPKDAFYAHQVMWDGWVDTENYKTHIIGHWNYEPEVKKDVYVVSSGDAVELFINGESQGIGRRSKHFLFTFDSIQWKPGTLTAVSYNKEMKELSRDEIRTAGEPVALQMKVMHGPDGFMADGADLALIEFEVVDSSGYRCPLANNMIAFELEGAAEWRGGIAQGTDNYILAKELPVECGVNRVLLRSLPKAGTVKLTATSEGLASASVAFHSTPVKVKNGLSEYISGEHQLLNLASGATPSTPSYTDKRFSVEIVGATAGANEDKAHLSYDDNELSEWTNGGSLATGWITYELERDAVISEISMKLTGWRMRSYPIQILVDDEEVYSGSTAKSLGYVTIPIKPARGRFVTIRLIGQSEDKDAFGGIIEVTGTKELDLYKDPDALKAKGQLRIVEVEFYEKEKVAPKPLYRDPVYDGAADPVVIWNKNEKRWFMFYTNRRANMTNANGVDWVHGTPVGIAESTDGGTTWTYRKDANINYGKGEYTYWAPDVIEDNGTYHMFLTIVPGVFSDWQHPREIVHLTSKNLIDWDFYSKIPLASEKVIDASVIKGPDGMWWIFYNNEADKKTIYYAVSRDLNHWEDKGKIIDRRGEGPKVFFWKNRYFLIMDTWEGQAVYSSPDLKKWERQQEMILRAPGKGIDDRVNGLHADVVVSGERAYIFYFTHPGRVGEDAKKDNYNTRRSSIQVAELEYINGKVTCDRDKDVQVILENKVNP